MYIEGGEGSRGSEMEVGGNVGEYVSRKVVGLKEM